MCRVCIFITLIIVWCSSFSARGESLRVGVYYYPGWRSDGQLVKSDPWLAIKKFPEREPLLGWYSEGDQDVANLQLRWMRDYGINFVIYDWYWLNGKGPVLDQAVKAYLTSPVSANIDFCILWANHTGSPSSLDEFDRIVDYWISEYFSKKTYFKEGYSPVVFIFSPEQFEVDAKAFNSTTKSLLDRARMRARRAGLNGIFFVASAQAVADRVIEIIPKSGYDAISAYNYHQGLSGKYIDKPMSKSYRELVNGYEQSWRWILENSLLPYFIPTTSGWDKRPWGGSKEPNHDKSKGTAAEFREHVSRARSYARRWPVRSLNTIVICCWNEFGEGSYIEPTKRDGFAFLDAIKKSDEFGTR